MPALIFLVIATAGGNLFGFLSQLAYNSGILSKFASAREAHERFPFLVSRSLTAFHSCFWMPFGPNEPMKRPFLDCRSARMTFQVWLFCNVVWTEQEK